ncbi:MAG: PAC2 family protein [Elusimicrobia bacterium]|nr:PAC2 family protein [Elusimicrobiota bacterium]MDE2237928.1 PAC2 family protein [Elusimicrobiota bacterium]MDE2426399.1 PAC2 family protein [Elusimicrobiota bacterium]
MAKTPERWLVAAWPGMGQVAATAAVYLLSKLGMHQLGEFTARDLFELDSVDVGSGLLRATRLPRSRLFLWPDPAGKRDIVVFLGEAQPPTGKLALCQRLIKESQALGVRRVFTFSAIASDMAPNTPSRVFAVASDPETLSELTRHGVALLADGRISGLNGVALAAAAEAGLPAVGLLGEMPTIAPQLPYPNAAAGVLRVFSELAGLDLDFGELEEYGAAMQQQLMRIYQQIARALSESSPQGEPEGPSEAAAQAPAASAPPSSEPELDEEEARSIERLFRQARADRSKAFELKKELDRLGIFRRYEDRFLDLFESRPPS